MKNFLIKLLSLTAIISILSSGIAIAEPQYAFVRIYYSGPDLKEKVGWWSQSCTNQTRSGQITSYYTVEEGMQCYPDLDANGERTWGTPGFRWSDIPTYCAGGRQMSWPFACKQ